MSNSANFLAFDLGAESGRAILGRLTEGRLGLSEVHRFSNSPVRCPIGPVMCRCTGMSCICGTKSNKESPAAGREGPPAGIGVDTWGVDFGLPNRHGRLIGNPYHYRDARADGSLAEAFRRTPRV